MFGMKKEGDSRVKALLDKADLKYEVDTDGDFKLVNGVGNGRTQVVFINSNTYQLQHMEMRQVWSVGYVSDGVMPPSIAKDLLRENAEIKLGGWEVRGFSGVETGIFRVQIAADADLTALALALSVVGKTADEKEKELLHNDAL